MSTTVKLFLAPLVLPKFNKKNFLAADLQPTALSFVAGHPESTWNDQKLVLLHKNCPDAVTEAFLLSPVWYKRLTAGLAKHKRAKYLPRLYVDQKSTVRAAAYKTALVENLDNTAEVAKRILEDKWVHGYFYSFHDRRKYIELLASGLSIQEVDTIANTDYEAEQEHYKPELLLRGQNV